MHRRWHRAAWPRLAIVEDAALFGVELAFLEFLVARHNGSPGLEDLRPDHTVQALTANLSSSWPGFDPAIYAGLRTSPGMRRKGRGFVKEGGRNAAAQARRVGGFGGRARLRDDDAVLRRARPGSAIATIRRARELGVDFLDSSDAYGAGRNEELIARAVEGHRGDYVIASKFGNLEPAGGPRFADGRPEYVREACEQEPASGSGPMSSTSITSTGSIRPCRSRTRSAR